jgi:hypothetical protein
MTQVQPSSVIHPYDTLFPKQIEFMHRPARCDIDMVCYQGGFGSGKTFCGSLLGILLSLRYSGIRGLVTADSFTLLRDTTIISYLEHFEAFGLVSGTHYKIRGGAGNGSATIEFFNGSTILFKGGRDPEKLKSLNLGWAHGEEASQLSEATHNMIVSRLRQPSVACHRLFYTTNPQPNKGWVYKQFVKNSGLFTDVVNDKLIRINRRRIIAPTTDNKALSGAYVANMQNTFDPEYYRINVLGEDGDYNSGLVCYTWTEANIDEFRCSYDPNYPIYLTCDFNVDPMCWGLAHYINGEVRFFDELAMGPITTHAAAREIGRRYQHHNGGIVITGDASGQSRRVEQQDIQLTNYKIIKDVLMSEYHIPNVDINVRASNPLIDTRISTFNSAVCNGGGIRRVFASKRCSKIIYNMENLKYIEGSGEIASAKAGTKAMELNPEMRYLGHMYDAISYLVYKLMPIDQQLNWYTPNETVLVPYGDTVRRSYR